MTVTRFIVAAAVLVESLIASLSSLSYIARWQPAPSVETAADGKYIVCRW